MDKTTKVPVRGRTCGEVFYTFPDSNLVRTFNFGETQYIDFEELEKLSFMPGGMYMIRNSLIIPPDVLEELGVTDVAPEYFYTEAEVEELLTNGTLDQLEDTLNFAPKGVIDLILQLSVKNKLYDTRKRDLIFKKTGFNIDGALEIEKVMEQDNGEESAAAAAPARKAEPIKSAAPERKTAAPKYKVVDKK